MARARSAVRPSRLTGDPGPDRHAAALPEPAGLRLRPGRLRPAPEVRQRPGVGPHAARPRSGPGGRDRSGDVLVVPRHGRRPGRPVGGPGQRAPRPGESTPPTSRTGRWCARSARPVGSSRTWSLWSDHLHVHAAHDTAWVYRSAYDQTIRKHALGTFEDLLVACELRPAMLLYLDTWTSTRDHPTEDQAREMLELHSVGRASGYTEVMVQDSARILSGHTVDTYGSWAVSHLPGRHAFGPVQVLGHTDATGRPTGGRPRWPTSTTWLTTRPQRGPSHRAVSALRSRPAVDGAGRARRPG